MSRVTSMIHEVPEEVLRIGAEVIIIDETLEVFAECLT